jgi:hypothetical protein
MSRYHLVVSPVIGKAPAGFALKLNRTRRTIGANTNA